MNPQPTKILALDLSLARTGYAFSDGKTTESGTQSFTFSKSQDPAVRYYDFDYWFRSLIHLYEPSLIVYEKGLHRGLAATEAAMGLTVLVKTNCYRNSIRYDCIFSTSLKKFSTGCGTADKGCMKAHAAQKWAHYDPSTDPGGDEADALHLLHWAQSGCVQPEKTPKKRKKKEAA